MLLSGTKASEGGDVNYPRTCILYCSDQCGASRITRGSSAPYSEICHTSQQAAPHSKIVSQGFKIAKIAKNAPKNRKMFRLRRIRDSPPVLRLGKDVQPSKTLFRGAARGLRAPRRTEQPVMRHSPPRRIRLSFRGRHTSHPAPHWSEQYSTSYLSVP